MKSKLLKLVVLLSLLLPIQVNADSHQITTAQQCWNYSFTLTYNPGYATLFCNTTAVNNAPVVPASLITNSYVYVFRTSLCADENDLTCTPISDGDPITEGRHYFKYRVTPNGPWVYVNAVWTNLRGWSEFRDTFQNPTTVIGTGPTLTAPDFNPNAAEATTTVYFQFSEDVTGFSIEDIVDIDSSRLSNFTVISPSRYSVDVDKVGTAHFFGVNLNTYSSVNGGLSGNGRLAVSLSAYDSLARITSATYDASMGTLIVTGTNFVANTGATNDVDTSLLTFTGEGGATYTLTSDDVEIDSATQFTITLNATDKAALEAILNKNGTASDDSTTYNIAAAEDWMPGAPAADTVADLTGNGVSVSGLDETAPTATISPANGATSVAADGKITITFDEAVRLLNDDPLTNADLANLITLKDTNDNGADIPFSATINGNVIIITPTSNFTSLQQVYVAIGATVEDEADNAISPVNATFTAEADTTAPVGTFGLANGATELARDGAITLTFDEAVRLLDGTAPTNENIAELITLKDTNGSGADIPFDVSIDGNVITITPVDNLSYGQQVYVAIGATLEDEADNAISPINATFTAETDTTAPTATISPGNGATNVAEDSTITITFDEAVRLLDGAALTNDNIAALITLKDTDGNGADIPFVATINGNVVTITPTSNFAPSQQVYVAIDATVEDAADNVISPASATFTAIDYKKPSLEITGPTEPVTEAFPLTFTFSEDVTGFNVNDITISGGTLSGFSGSGDTYTVIVTPVLGETVTVSVAANAAEDAAGNGNEASETYTVQAGSPAAEFEANRRAIEDILIGEMTRSVRSNIAASSNMVRDARGRFISAQDCGEADNANDAAVSSDEVVDARCANIGATNTVQPFDIDGVASANGTTLSTRGTARAEVQYNDNQSRRLFWGNFDIQHDGTTGSTSATLSGRMIWEQMLGEDTMLGYFVGAEVNNGEIGGPFVGDQTRLGVSVGGYVVQRLEEHLYADGYLSFGLGNSDLDISNGTLDLQSKYASQSVTAGASLSGLYAYEQYEFRPELAINYGRTELGTVGFTGTAYGITDDTLSLEAGSLTITTLTLRPEVLFAVDGGSVAQSRAVMSFAPRLICEQTSSTLRPDTDDCGGGAEIGFKATSEDGLSNLSLQFAIDEIGNTRRSSGNLGVELRF